MYLYLFFQTELLLLCVSHLIEELINVLFALFTALLYTYRIAACIQVILVNRIVRICSRIHCKINKQRMATDNDILNMHKCKYGLDLNNEYL